MGSLEMDNWVRVGTREGQVHGTFAESHVTVFFLDNRCLEKIEVSECKLIDANEVRLCLLGLAVSIQLPTGPTERLEGIVRGQKRIKDRLFVSVVGCVDHEDIPCDFPAEWIRTNPFILLSLEERVIVH